MSIKHRCTDDWSKQKEGEWMEWVWPVSKSDIRELYS